MTLAELNRKLNVFAKPLNCELKIFQSNYEGGLIDLLHKHRKWADGVVFNPGAFTHYSYALRDAVAGIQAPTIEVHLSDIHKREEFRRISVIAPVCIQQISGLGVKSYMDAIEKLTAQRAR
jgi:3-dehydroquinate dehydratase-2